jgi:hypothetical protein
VANGVAASAATQGTDPPAPVRKLLSEPDPANTVAELLNQYPGVKVNYTDISKDMAAPVPVGRNVSHFRILRTVPDAPGTEELLMFHAISIRMDERALIEVWVNKPDVTVASKLDWHYVGALTSVGPFLQLWTFPGLADSTLA